MVQDTEELTRIKPRKQNKKALTTGQITTPDIALKPREAPVQRKSPVRKPPQATVFQDEGCQLMVKKMIEEQLFNLDSIIANMPGYVYWKNTKSEYMGCNNNMALVSGLKDRSEIIGKTDQDFEWGKNQAAEFKKDDEKVMQSGLKKVTEHTLPIPREDDHLLIVRTEKMPLYNQAQEIIGVLAIAIDITDQKITEKLIEEKEKSEALNKAKNRFIRDMEHDIRTPFSGVLALAKILEREETDKHKKEKLSAVTASAQELLELCNFILDFSRIESDTLPHLHKKFDLRKLIRGIIEMERPAAMIKNLELIQNYPDDVPAIFIGDSRKIQRILTNLVSNAVKFTHKGYVKITVELIKETSERDIILRILVEDTGVGIPQEKQDFIYEKFNRLTPANQGIYKGFGLGLSIVKRLIDDLGGEIDVNSHPERGSIFACTLPLGRPLIDEVLFEDKPQ